jgi:predicted GH43/DUF377 family glycosyl hydrolase
MINSPADSELFVRHAGNPLLTASQWPYPMNVVMNAGATLFEGTTVLLCRVEDRRGFSHLTVARSADGVSDWQIDDQPLMQSRPGHPAEEWGLEDARLTRVDELDCWVIAYTVYGRGGPALALATTKDFRSVERVGTVRGPEDKNGGLLSRRVNGEFVLFHRPVSVIGARADVWLSRSSDLRRWSSPEPVMTARPGGWWDAARIGIGPPPIETAEGWLLIYHGVRITVAGALYRVGLALLDLEEPERVIARCDEWVLGPTASYEQVGDVPGVVFPCGYVHDPDTDELRLYYGAADSCIGMASAPLSAIMDRVRSGSLQD